MVTIVEFPNNKKAVRIISKVSFFCKAKTYWQEALTELKKVVWPTRKETMQATLAVVVMVFVMGILMWTIDACLVRVVAKIVSPS
jgi:preprotein translocase subunit SecE